MTVNRESASHDALTDDLQVLENRPLRSGITVAETACYSDDTWLLTPAILQQHVKATRLTFTAVPQPFRAVAKQLMYTMLSGTLPPGERRQSVSSIYRAFVDVRRFVHWLHANYPNTMVREVSPADLLNYQRYLLASSLTAGSRENARRAVGLLWRYRAHLTDPLTIEPRHTRGWATPAGRPGENATARIPEPVLGPLIAWALRFIDDFAPDILAARTYWLTYRSTTSNGRMGRNRGLPEALDAYLHEHLTSGRPLPGDRGHVNLAFINAVIGAAPRGGTHHILKEKIRKAATQVGVDNCSRLPTPITGTIDGQPWTQAITLRHPVYYVAYLTRHLHTACWIALAFFSGMRDAELKHLRRGCLTVRRDTDGHPYRWTVRGTAFKGEPSPAGAPATWTIGAPAARAVAVLEGIAVGDLLFTHPANARSTTPRAVRTTASTNTHLASFAAWVNSYCAHRARGDAIPLVNGQPWVFSTRQFRRTLAWFIARQPGGSIAGAIQYRHLGIQMFEGYAGTSDSGFRAEVEAEQALTRGEYLLSLIDGHDHQTLTGPAADEAHQRLAQFAGHTRYQGAVITDPRQLKRLMRQKDPAIYPGTFATCIYNANKALCHPSGGRATSPQVSHCQPLHCSNVALTPDNLDALRAEHHKICANLDKGRALPPLVQHRLTQQLTQITEFLNRHCAETPT